MGKGPFGDAEIESPHLPIGLKHSGRRGFATDGNRAVEGRRQRRDRDAFGHDRHFGQRTFGKTALLIAPIPGPRRILVGPQPTVVLTGIGFPAR